MFTQTRIVKKLFYVEKQMLSCVISNHLRSSDEILEHHQIAFPKYLDPTEVILC